MTRVRHATGESVGARETFVQAVVDVFRKFAHEASIVVGSPWAFLLAVVAILTWACLGPRFRYSDTWQLVINTGTTIVTFLMVFLIQNTQNRDARAIHLKLDELIRGLHGRGTSWLTLRISPMSNSINWRRSSSGCASRDIGLKRRESE